mgnify:CR=1 FL=1
MYFIIIAIIAVFMFLEMFNKDIVEKYKYVFAFICFTLLVFQDGFRWETGTDWDPYHNFFEELTISIQPDDSEFDIGYILFSYIIRIITDNYTVFLTVFAVLFYSAFFYFIFSLYFPINLLYGNSILYGNESTVHGYDVLCHRISWISKWEKNAIYSTVNYWSIFP